LGTLELNNINFINNLQSEVRTGCRDGSQQSDGSSTPALASLRKQAKSISTNEIGEFAPPLNTESGTPSQEVTNTQIVKLLLSGRIFYELARVAPGPRCVPCPDDKVWRRLPMRSRAGTQFLPERQDRQRRDWCDDNTTCEAEMLFAGRVPLLRVGVSRRSALPERRYIIPVCACCEPCHLPSRYPG